MKRLNDYIVENANSARGARKHPRRDRDSAGEWSEVRVIRSFGLDAATVSLPAGIDLETRAQWMNQFWRALVQFQYGDVVVIAVCATGGRKRR
jgi:hypothetical protein